MSGSLAISTSSKHNSPCLKCQMSREGQSDQKEQAQAVKTGISSSFRKTGVSQNINFCSVSLQSLKIPVRPSHYLLSLVLGSLGCSGLSGKLLHQTGVSSSGSLAGWLLQKLPYKTSKESQSAFMESSNETHQHGPRCFRFC